MKKVSDDVFSGIVKLKTKSIKRIHRLGKRTEGRDRPTIIRLADFGDKTKILGHFSILKESNISVSEEYSKRIIEIRKSLWASSQEEW